MQEGVFAIGKAGTLLTALPPFGMQLLGRPKTVLAPPTQIQIVLFLAIGVLSDAVTKRDTRILDPIG